MDDRLDIHCTHGHRPSPQKTASKFCVLCGAPIVVTCPEGHEVRPAPYCSVCGSSLEAPPGPRNSAAGCTPPASPDERSSIAGTPPGAGWSASEEGRPQAPRRPEKRFAGSRALVVIGVALVSLLIGAGAYFGTALLTDSHPEPTTAPPPASSPGSDDPARKEAAALNVLLDRSITDRATVVAAVEDIGRCSNLSSAQRHLGEAAASRRTMLDQLGQMNVSDISSGEQLRTDLQGAWRSSEQSDQNYLSWAGEVQNAHCSTANSAPHTSSYTAAQSTDREATQGKDAFVALWNPIASDYGLPQRRAGEL